MTFFWRFWPTGIFPTVLKLSTKFLWWQPFMVNCAIQNKQIFATIFQARIWCHIFEAFNSSLLVLVTGVYKICYFHKTMISAESVHTRSSRTKYLNKKVKPKKMVPKLFLSKTIHAQENGSSFCKIPNFLLPKGLNLYR